MVNQSCEVVVIGAGAAGLFCAAEAAKRGRSVLVIEHNTQPGRKILISGGGRCNFTNINTRPEHFLSHNPHFCRSALSRYTPLDFIALVERHGIAYHEKKLGQLFCDESAQQIVSMLLNECKINHTQFLYNCAVKQVKKPERFCLRTSNGVIECDSLVIATGGLSIKQLGASDFGYTIARQFGLKQVETKPGLVPLTLSAQDKQRFQDLSGVSVDTIAQCGGVEFHEKSLITHRGLSGPAILQISSYWNEGEPVFLNLLPGTNPRQLLDDIGHENRKLRGALERHWPKRFARLWCKQHTPDKTLPHYTKDEIEHVIENLQRWPIYPAGTEGYRKAEVTLGGVDTTELSPKSMESRKVAGLYFIGEVVDVTGHLGGYNFQWAWASAFAAGQVC